MNIGLYNINSNSLHEIEKEISQNPELKILRI